MGVSRIILRKGDVFRIEITRNQVFYMQYVANDINQLNGDVIRVFAKRYTAKDNPLIEHIVSGEINFYCHVFLKRGVQLGYWTKYGHSNILGSLKNISKYMTKI